MLFLFEGLDGVGKTTIISKLYNYYQAMNYNIFVVNPFNTAIGRKIKPLIVEDNMIPIGKLGLARTANAHLFVEVIQPLLFANPKTIIFCDRFVLSTMVYQIDNLTNFDYEKRLLEDINDNIVLFFLDGERDFILRNKPVAEQDNLEKVVLEEKRFQILRAKYLSLFNEINLKNKFRLPVKENFQSVSNVSRIIDRFID